MSRFLWFTVYVGCKHKRKQGFKVNKRQSEVCPSRGGKPSQVRGFGASSEFFKAVRTTVGRPLCYAAELFLPSRLVRPTWSSGQKSISGWITRKKWSYISPIPPLTLQGGRVKKCEIWPRFFDFSRLWRSVLSKRNNTSHHKSYFRNLDVLYLSQIFTGLHPPRIWYSSFPSCENQSERNCRFSKLDGKMGWISECVQWPRANSTVTYGELELWAHSPITSP